MTEPTSTPDASELDSLLGAYALDALDPLDRARVEAYLERHAQARAEVDEMRETAASLALLPDTPMSAPPELWNRIAGEIATAAPEQHDEVAARRSKRARWIAPVAVAAAVAIVVLAVKVDSLRGQLNQAHQAGPPAMAIAFDHAAKAPGAREVGLQSPAGATLARVVLLPDGAGYLKGDHLATLPASKTYQLWAVTGSAARPRVVSAGVLGPDPQALAFHASGPVRSFAVTVEKTGGVVVSHNQPVATGAVA